MTPSIFSQKGESFLRDEMCICLDDLTSMILTDAPQETKFFKDMIDDYLTIKFPSSSYNNITISEERKNKKDIESKLNSFYDDKLEDDTKTFSIYKELFHVLTSYSRQGLSGVWYHREASLWYPKVIITKNFGSRDDVDSLDDIVTIYRGTSEDEFESNKFGQAWSLSKGVANRFAFEFYNKSPNYINTLRVVIQAKINKNDIYHYRKGHRENEVVINPIKLIDGSIQVLECKKLTTK